MFMYDIYFAATTPPTDPPPTEPPSTEPPSTEPPSTEATTADSQTTADPGKSISEQDVAVGNKQYYL